MGKLLATRYLLCRPLGGFNDALNQIQICLEYAREFERTLLLDLSVNPFVAEVLSFVKFSFDPGHFPVVIIEEPPDLLNGLSVFPSELEGRVTEYEAVLKTGFTKSLRFDKKTGAFLSFDFDSNYDHELLVHHCGGGGGLGHSFLANLEFTDAARREIRDRLSNLPAVFDFIHVRATDYSTDLTVLTRRLKRFRDIRNLYVATDNYDAFVYLKDHLPGVNLFSLSRNSDYRGKPIHRNVHQHASQELHFEALRVWVDICIAAMSRRFFYTNLHVPGQPRRILISGFTILLRDVASASGRLTLLTGIDVDGKGVTEVRPLIGGGLRARRFLRVLVRRLRRRLLAR